ncbi:kinase-like domain-containing protein [Gigaspora rosea]|uniref:Kinase-like domain-containing protein n=1 Tax=Gigaspora rosea TaxID=44941 RepID=A0A397VMM8_9GLOM|nr:kinase-like domain-containing protein [Gigaspora rosea]
MESFRVLHCYGVSQDPSTKNYILVMQYASEGNLQSYLDNSFTRFTWHQKINMFRDIVLGLKAIHSEYLIHCDLHSGNILRHGYGNDSDNLDTYISDIGLCHPVVDSKEKEKVFGVLPYIAPEVLRGDRYTKASDIYSLGIIMWEITSGEKPFMDRAHNEELAKDICNGLRPTIINNTPECYAQVMKQCWDANPLIRPTVENLAVIIKEFREVSDYKVQIMDAEYHRKVMAEKVFAGKVELKKKKHPEAIYSSRQFDFMDLPLPKNAPEPLSAQSDNNRALEVDNGNF